MNIKKIRFWDTENKMMLTSAVSCVTAFRNYINVAAPSGFSDIDNQPKQGKYVPMLCTGKKDKNDREIWEGDLVLLCMNMGGMEVKLKSIIVYDESEAMFCVEPIEDNKEHDSAPLLGLKDEIEVIGNVYENK